MFGGEKMDIYEGAGYNTFLVFPFPVMVFTEGVIATFKTVQYTGVTRK